MGYKCFRVAYRIIRRNRMRFAPRKGLNSAVLYSYSYFFKVHLKASLVTKLRISGYCSYFSKNLFLGYIVVVVVTLISTAGVAWRRINPYRLNFITCFLTQLEEPKTRSFRRELGTNLIIFKTQGFLCFMKTDRFRVFSKVWPSGRVYIFGRLVFATKGSCCKN